MALLPRLLIIFGISIGCIGCDQSTKLVAKDLLQFEAPKSYLYDTLRVMYSENGGAFLGMGDSLSLEVRLLLFQAIVSGLLLSLFLYLVLSKRLDTTEIIGLSLFLAGGASNLIDRFTNNGFVVDFLNVGVGPVRTGIFNIADMAILLGAMVVLLSQVKQRRQIPSE